jgi:hypothetical protein
MVEAVELVACHVQPAELTRQRVTFGDVERYLAQLAAHHHGCTYGRCVLVSRVDGTPGLCDRQRLAASGACDQGACDALIDVIVVRAEVRRLRRPEP